MSTGIELGGGGGGGVVLVNCALYCPFPPLQKLKQDLNRHLVLLHICMALQVR